MVADAEILLILFLLRYSILRVLLSQYVVRYCSFATDSALVAHVEFLGVRFGFMALGNEGHTVASARTREL